MRLKKFTNTKLNFCYYLFFPPSKINIYRKKEEITSRSFVNPLLCATGNSQSLVHSRKVILERVCLRMNILFFFKLIPHLKIWEKKKLDRFWNNDDELRELKLTKSVKVPFSQKLDRVFRKSLQISIIIDH